MGKNIFSLCVALLLYVYHVNGQNLSLKEEELVRKFQDINSQKTIDRMDSCNQNFIELFCKVLQLKSSFDYPFLKLKNIGKVTSNDNKVRCYSWNLLPLDGKYRYYSFLQVKKEDGSYFCAQLFDNNSQEKIDERAVISTNNWYGALYYKLIKFDNSNRGDYILLGWDGNNSKMSRKIIDVLRINPDNTLTLGLPIFIADKESKNRQVFEYSSKCNMTLYYDKKSKRIIFDHLVPIYPNYEGNHEFYGPDYSFDAYELKNKKWVYKSNIRMY